MESSVIVLFRKLINLGIFNINWMPIQSKHYLIGIFENKISIGVLISNQAYDMTHMVTLSGPSTHQTGEMKIVFEEGKEVFELELENILQAMVDVYPAEVGELATLGFSYMAYPNVQSLIGKLDDIGERLGNPLIELQREGKEIKFDKFVFGNEMKSSLPSIKPEELANHFFSRLAEIGVKPPFCVPYYYHVGGCSFTVSMHPEAKALTICAEVSVAKFKTFAFIAPGSFPQEAEVTQELLEVLEGAYRTVVEFDGKPYEKLLVDISGEPLTRTEFFEANPGIHKTLSTAQLSVPELVESMRGNGTRITQGDYVIAQLWDKLLKRQLFVANRLPYVTQDGQVAVFVSRSPFLISVCTNTGNVLEVPAGHLEGSGKGFKRICWLRNGRVTWAENAVRVVDGEFGYPQLEATLRGLLVSLEGLDQDPVGRGLTTEATFRLMAEQNPHLYFIDPVARDAYIAKMKRELPGIINDDGGIDVIALASKARRKSETLGVVDLSKWTPGSKGYISREAFGEDTEGYITHLERVIELARMTPAEFMEDAKRSAAELEQMYPTPARLINPLPRFPHTDFYFPHQVDLSALDGVDVERQVDWTAIVTPPAFMGKAPSKFTLSLPHDPLFGAFANSEFIHKWMDLIHTTNETFRLEGNERLSSVESSIRFEVADSGVPMVVRPAGEPNKFYLEEDQPKGARFADLTLEGDRITVDIHNDEVFPIAGAERVLIAMLTAIKEHMTK